MTMKTSIKKSRKICIFPKGLVYGFGQKFQISSSSFFLGTIARENVCGDVLGRKLAFLDYENID